MKTNAVDDLDDNFQENLLCQRAYVCHNWRFYVEMFVPGDISWEAWHENQDTGALANGLCNVFVDKVKQVKVMMDTGQCCFRGHYLLTSFQPYMSKAFLCIRDRRRGWESDPSCSTKDVTFVFYSCVCSQGVQLRDINNGAFRAAIFGRRCCLWYWMAALLLPFAIDAIATSSVTAATPLSSALLISSSTVDAVLSCSTTAALSSRR